MDIEGGAAEDSASIAVRSKALAILRVKNPALHITITLAATPTGLDAHGVSILQAGLDAGFHPNGTIFSLLPSH